MGGKELRRGSVRNRFAALQLPTSVGQAFSKTQMSWTAAQHRIYRFRPVTAASVRVLLSVLYYT